jgi:hypothetical protein
MAKMNLIHAIAKRFADQTDKGSGRMAADALMTLLAYRIPTKKTGTARKFDNFIFTECTG